MGISCRASLAKSDKRGSTGWPLKTFVYPNRSRPGCERWDHQKIYLEGTGESFTDQFQTFWWLRRSKASSRCKYLLFFRLLSAFLPIRQSLSNREKKLRSPPQQDTLHKWPNPDCKTRSRECRKLCLEASKIYSHQACFYMIWDARLCHLFYSLANRSHLAPKTHNWNQSYRNFA